MLKKLIFTLVVFFFFCVAAQAQIPIPARIGGTLTVNGVLITADDIEGYVIKVSRQDATFFDPLAETDELNSSGIYIIDIPLFEEGVQDGGANPGDTAVINVYKDGSKLEIISPAGGLIIVGESSDQNEYNLDVKMEVPDLKADAGPDQTVNSGDLVTLDASGSFAQTYKWEQLEGVAVALSDDSGVKPTFTAPVLTLSEMTFIFKLTVTQDNTSKSDTVNIIVKSLPQNQNPEADAGDSHTAYPGDLVKLDGSGSGDKEGTVTYQWEQIGGTFVALSDAVSVSPEFTAPDYNPDLDMTLIFKLTVTDNTGQTAFDTVTISIISASQNLPPVASAGSDQTVSAGEKVQLDGSNSTDPDNGQGNGIYSYTWLQIGNGTRVNLSNNKIARPVFTAPDVESQGESLTFELRVSDKEGLEDSDSVTINIVSENQPPTANAGQDRSVKAGNIVYLDGSASSDPDPGDIITYKWQQTSGIDVVLSDDTNSSPFFTAPETENSVSSLVFELIVEDKGGLRHTDEVYVNIITDTISAPVADAGQDQTVKAGDKVILDGSNSTSSSKKIFLWSQKAGDTPVTLSEAKAVRPEFIAPDVESEGALLVFELTVVDTSSGLMDTDEVAIKVNYTGTNPVARAGDDTVIDEGTTGILDGSDSSPSGNIVEFYWRQISGPAVEISNPNAEKTTFFVPGVANDNVQLVFELTIRDSSGLSDTDQVTLYINDFGEGPGADDSSCFINTIL